MKLFLLAVSAAFAGKNPNCNPASDNPEFACTADCENLYIECVMGCSTDPSCISSCNRESMACQTKVTVW